MIRETHHWYARILGLGVAWLLASGTAVALEYREAQTPTLGEAIYVAEQGSPLSAISMIMLDIEKQRLGEETELGQMFLAEQMTDIGLHDEALAVYKNIGTDTQLNASIRDQAWLNYAKLQYQHDRVDWNTLANIGTSLSEAQQSELDTVKAHLYLNEGKAEKAYRTLPSINTDHTLWALYQRYNLGIKLLNDQEKYGAALLHELSIFKNKDLATPEVSALKNQAKLALGFSLLQLGNAAKAREYLQNIQLDSQMANMALLGMGWSFSLEEDYENALTFWLELQSKPLSNAYTYEALLAIPYAFGQAKAYNQAKNYYNVALTRFNNDIVAMEELKHSIQSKRFIALLSTVPAKETAWLENWQQTPGDAESLLLLLLLDNQNFQQELKKYRNLLQLNIHFTNLRKKIDQLESFSGGRITAINKQYQELGQKMGTAVRKQQHTLQKLALNIIDRYQNQLNDYVKQAQFGIAQVVEQATLLREGE